MWTTFAAFVQKEFFHILRDRRTLGIMLGMPFALVLLFGYAVTTDFKQAAFALLDQARDPWSARVAQRLEATGYFQLVAQTPDIESVESLFRRGEIKMALVLPPHFGEDLQACRPVSVQLLTDGSEPNIASLLAAYAADVRAGLARSMTAESGRRAVTSYGPVLVLMVPVALLFLLYPTLVGLRSLATGS